MRVFVTGASGFIGSAVVSELQAAGHEVLGLARSDASAEALSKAGVKAHRGDLNDTASLEAAVRETEGVVHMGFIHDFANFEASLRTDRAAIEAMGKALEGSGRPLVIASGTLGLAPGKLATEDVPSEGHPRMVNAAVALGFAQRGVRVSILRLSPTVHGKGDHGFVPELIRVAREKGVSRYIDDGSSRWNAVHRLDAARLCRLAVEKASPGAILHAVAEESVSSKTIAETIGRKLGIPVTAVAASEALAHFGWIGRFFSMDQPASSAFTRAQMGWLPTHPTLLEDLEEGHYFR